MIPFVIWSLIGCVYKISDKKIYIRDLSVKTFLEWMDHTSIIDVYWFFIPLFTVYMCIPALSMIPRQNRKAIFKYLLIFGFVINNLLPFICSLTTFDWNTSLNVTMTWGYLIYVLAGYYIDHYDIGQRLRKCIYVLGVGGLLAHILGTAVLSYRDALVNSTFKGYLNVPCILYSIAIFTWFKYMDSTRMMERWYRIAKVFSNATFGVYLIHWYFLDTIVRVTEILATSIFYRVGGGTGVFFMSVVIVKVMKRIPLLKHIVP